MIKYISITILLSISLAAQQSLMHYTLDSLEINIINTSLDKLVNTYILQNYAFFQTDVLGGTLNFRQQYTGSTVNAGRFTSRDDELYNIEYMYPVSENIELLAGQNWQISSDSKAIGLFELERLNGIAGLKYNFENNSYFRAAAGIEQYSQVEVSSAGNIYVVSSKLNDINIGGFQLNTKLSGEHLALSSGINNSNLTFNAYGYKTFEYGNSLNIGLDYRYLNNDNLSGFISQMDDYSIENRIENNIGINLLLGLDILENLSGSIDLNFGNRDVSRSYNELIPTISQSGAFRNSSSLNLGANAKINLVTNESETIAGMLFEVSGESNAIDRKFNILPEDLQRLRSIESQRDYDASNTRLYFNTRYFPWVKDTFHINFSSSILRYNTPSGNNNDDRDKLSLITELGYSRKLNPYLYFSVSGRLYFVHYVYLRATRSAQNNWNRVISLRPSILFDVGIIKLRPTFEVLANYTVYDFEDKVSGINSFSFRQLSYSDSLYLGFTNRISLQSSVYFRYYENGLLYWKSFAETPQNSNFENLSKGYLFLKQDENVAIAAGARYYFLKTINLQQGLATPSNRDYRLISIGPQALISYEFESGSEIRFEGWYEFQRVNQQDVREIPNLFMNVRLKF